MIGNNNPDFQNDLQEKWPYSEQVNYTFYNAL